MSDLVITGSGYRANFSPTSVLEDSPPSQLATNGYRIIPKGNAPSTFMYKVSNSGSLLGSAYQANLSSSMAGERCVSVFGRGAGFNATSSSTQKYSNSASCYGAIGFHASVGSSQVIERCTSSVHSTNYAAVETSVLNLKESASVFPTDIGVLANKTSSAALDNFETMTYWWGTTIKVPVMFRSSQRSFINCNSENLGTTSAAIGSTGSVLNSDSLRFVWVSFAPGPPPATNPDPNATNGSFATNVDFYYRWQYGLLSMAGGANTWLASYRFVPVEHSIDWTVFTGSQGNTDVLSGYTGVTTGTGLVILISTRNGYQSNKPPKGLLVPEDNSGVRFPYGGQNVGNQSFSLWQSGLWS